MRKGLGLGSGPSSDNHYLIHVPILPYRPYRPVVLQNSRVFTCVNRFISGKPYGLYEVYWGEHVSVLQGCGLGGGSLINANVGLDAEPAVYQKPDWPAAFTSDVEKMLKTDRKHVTDMLEPTPYPESYPPLDKIERMQEGFAAFDIEDMDKYFYKTPIYVTFEDKKKNRVGVPQPKCTGCGNCCGGCNVGAKNTLNMNYIAEAKAYGAEIYTKVLCCRELHILFLD